MSHIDTHRQAFYRINDARALDVSKIMDQTAPLGVEDQDGLTFLMHMLESHIQKDASENTQTNDFSKQSSAHPKQSVLHKVSTKERSTSSLGTHDHHSKPHDSSHVQKLPVTKPASPGGKKSESLDKGGHQEDLNEAQRKSYEMDANVYDREPQDPLDSILNDTSSHALGYEQYDESDQPTLPDIMILDKRISVLDDALQNLTPDQNLVQDVDRPSVDIKNPVYEGEVRLNQSDNTLSFEQWTDPSETIDFSLDPSLDPSFDASFLMENEKFLKPRTDSLHAEASRVTDNMTSQRQPIVSDRLSNDLATHFMGYETPLEDSSPIRMPSQKADALIDLTPPAQLTPSLVSESLSSEQESDALTRAPVLEVSPHDAQDESAMSQHGEQEFSNAFSDQGRPTGKISVESTRTSPIKGLPGGFAPNPSGDPSVDSARHAQYQLAQDFRQAILLRQTAFDVYLTPKGMGQVNVRINFNKKEVEARFEVDGQSMPAFERQRHQFEGIFKAYGFKVSKGGLQLFIHKPEDPVKQSASQFDDLNVPITPITWTDESPYDVQPRRYTKTMLTPISRYRASV